MSETHWICRKCGGKGCKHCNETGWEPKK